MPTHYLKKELYELVKKEERIFDFIQDSSLDGLWYWDLENPENEWMNVRFWKVLGYDPEEMPHLASAWQELINQDDLKAALDNFHKHLENPDHPYDQNVRYTHKDGSTVWIRCRGVAIRNESGKAVRMLGAHQDLTSLKRKEIELQQAKEIERANREKYQFFIENTSDVIRVQKPGGAFEFISPNNKELTGYTVEEYLQFNPDENVLPEDREKLWNIIKRLEKGEDLLSVEYRIYHRSKNIIWIQSRIKAIRDEKGTLISILSTSHDITERKIAEIKLKENEQRLNLTIEGTGIGTWDMNIQTGEFTFDRQFSDMIGYIADDVVSTMDWWRTLVHPDDRPVTEKCLFDHFSSKSDMYESEYRVRHKAGHYIWIQDKGKVVEWNEEGKAQRIVGIHIDVTERKTTEAEINALTCSFEAALERSPDGIVIADSKGKHRYVNQRFSEMMGYSMDECLNLTINDITPVADLPKYAQMYKDRLNGRPAPNLYERTVIHKEGHTIPVEMRTTTTIWNGEPCGLAFMTDLTERKKAEEQQRKQDAFIRMVMDNLPIGIATNDLQSMKATYMNRKFEEIYGWPWDEMQTFEAFFEKLFPDKKYREKMRTQIMADIKSGDVNRMNWDDLKIMTQNGEERIIYAFNIPFPEQNIMISTIQDFTERKKAEFQVKQDHANLTALIENTSNMIWSVDNEYRLMTANSEFLKRCKAIYGEELKQGVLLLDKSRLPEALYTQWKKNYDRVLTGEKFSEEIEAVYSENKQYVENFYNPIFDENKNIIGVSGFSRDITQRKQVEQAIQASEERLRNIVENMPVMMDAFDENNHLVSWNRECERVTGYSKEEITLSAAPLEKMYPNADYRTRVTEELKNLKNNFRNKEYELTCKNGNRKIILWSNISKQYPVPGWHSWAIGLDVTEHRQAQEELKKYQEELEDLVLQRTKELEEKNTFLERMNDAMVDREFRIKELRDEIEVLKKRS